VSTFDILRTLCELPGPGGDERRVQEFLRERWVARGFEVDSDGAGNLTAHVGGQGPKLALCAHADEVCFTVRHIDDDGYLWLTSGQRDIEARPSLRAPYFLPLGHPALVITDGEPVPGVFATLTGHILTKAQRDTKHLEWNDIWVDVGAPSRGAAEDRGIRVGDRVIWSPPTRRVGDLVYAKAMDDRAGLAVLDLFAQRVDPRALAYDVYLVSTVQEELGLIGAASVSRRLDCELAIVVDIGLSGDVPGVDQKDVATRLGAGPILVHKDLYAYDRRLIRELERAAVSASIPVQHAVYVIYGSDAGEFVRAGVRAALVAIATRYTHSPFETVHLGDIEAAAALLERFARAS
jgi:putative aminopeptidase FrvX